MPKTIFARIFLRRLPPAIDSFSSALLRAFAIWILRFFGGDGALVGYIFFMVMFMVHVLCDLKMGGFM